MITKRLTLVAFAAAFAVSSSVAMLQSSRPALADADDHHPRVHQRAGYHWVNGQWVPNNWNGNPGKHKGWKHKKHDKDRDGGRH